MNTVGAAGMAEILAMDRQHVWHPYAAMASSLPVYPVQSASGVRIKLVDGRELIDGMASWWSVIHGYNHPVLNRALIDQAARMAHVMFGGLTHQPAVELAQLLASISPTGLEKVFFCDSGSVAVEVAMKMAIQYQYALGREEKNRFLSLRGGYHGDTFHAMAVCDPQGGMHQLYTGILPQYFFADRPNCSFHGDWLPHDIDSFTTLIARHRHELAAVILEPIVQGAGGMRFYHPEYLRQVRRLCDDHDVLLIADEIATGFGRSGRLFACEHAGIAPDILCLGKALTGGYMSLAAVLTSPTVAETIAKGKPGVFMHGPTFMANPLACSLALASVRLLLAGDWQADIQRIERGLQVGLQPCAALDQVSEVRVLGAIGVVELHQPVDMAITQARFVDQGVWVRPFGRLVYVMPPYCINEVDLQQLCAALCRVVALEGDRK